MRVVFVWLSYELGIILYFIHHYLSFKTPLSIVKLKKKKKKKKLKHKKKKKKKKELIYIYFF
jgi:hypothetical protein